MHKRQDMEVFFSWKYPDNVLIQSWDMFEDDHTIIHSTGFQGTLNQ